VTAVQQLSSQQTSRGEPTGEPPLAVLVVESSKHAERLSTLLETAEQLAVSQVDSLPGCELRLREGGFAVVVLDPELQQEWPDSVAERAIDVVAGRAGLVIVCRTPEDARSVDARIGAGKATVLSRHGLASDALVTIIRGVGAQRQTQ
jgi:hypothetical protein